MTGKQIDAIQVEPRNTRGWPKNERQLKFALAYIQEGLAAPKAAVKAGYSEKYADRRVHDVIKNLKPFLAFLQGKKNEVAHREFEASTSRVLSEITSAAMTRKSDLVRKVTVNGLPYFVGIPIDEVPENLRGAIADWTIKTVKTDDEGEVADFQYQLLDKTQNLFALGKHLGMFNEKIMLELTHREAQARRTNFSELPTDQIEQIMEQLEQFKQMARDATAIQSTATEVQ